jgi:opacity protein-like surface antigen
MRKSIVLTGLLLLATGLSLAQADFPKVETSPAFMYVRTPIANRDLNCAGAGGTLAYNLSSPLGIAFDGGGCKYFSNTFAAGNKVDGHLYTFLFGPRLTFRSHSPLTPFMDVNFGVARISLTCKSSAAECVNRTFGATVSKNAFALTAGGGFDLKLNKKIALRLIQADYLYTRFGNDCSLAVCGNSNSQNSFRLKSGLVIGWGGSASQ